MFDCGAADLLSFLPPSKLTHDGHYIAISSIWGWTDPQTKQEWALLGRRDGTTFVDITNPTQPARGRRSAAHRRRAAELVARDQGLQGPRVHRLGRRRPARHPDLRPHAAAHDEAAAERPAAESARPTSIYRNVNSVHDMVINEESGFALSGGIERRRQRPAAAAST